MVEQLSPKRSKIVERQCALTREPKQADDLIRFAVGPDDQLVPDVDGKAPGRGVWISLGQTFIEQAIKRNAFAKSLKSPVKVPADLAKITQSRLEQRLTGALGLSRKAGQIVTGATKVKSALANGSVSTLLTASDAAPDGRRKIMQSLHGAPNAGRIRHFELLSAEQMSLATGLENVIHAALTQGAAAQSAGNRADRLFRFLTQ